MLVPHRLVVRNGWQLLSFRAFKTIIGIRSAAKAEGFIDSRRCLELISAWSFSDVPNHRGADDRSA